MKSCALCEKNAVLMQSHIIPNLVYKRIRTFPNSRFRSMDNFGKELQDGEKRPMLCHDCEQKFSAFEVWFANHYIDKYLSNGSIPKIEDKYIRKLNDYILSVSWRILWDDLYRLNSFCDDSFRPELEGFEYRLRSYLNKGEECSFFENKIYKLDDLIQCPQELTERTLFGYTVYNNHYGGFVLAYYAGLVFITKYKDDRRITIQLESFDNYSFEEVVADELIYMFTTFQQQLKDKYTPEFQMKMKKRYKISRDS